MSASNGAPEGEKGRAVVEQGRRIYEEGSGGDGAGSLSPGAAEKVVTTDFECYSVRLPVMGQRS